MKLVFYSVVLNHHQAPVADELFKLLGDDFCFVELINLGDSKGGEDFSKRPYLLRAWDSPEAHAKAMEFARTAECCVFGGVDALPFEQERMRLGLLSFDMGERWLKKGWKNLASRRLWQWLKAYYFSGWKHKPLYKLCMSAFAADDHYKVGTFKYKAYKWGYFTKVNSSNFQLPNSNDDIVRMIWCARFIDWKHPELAIRLAKWLKAEGYSFHLDMYGEGELRNKMEIMVETLALKDHISFMGNVPNNQIRQAMYEHDIFLFTSDRCEGWGAVANEAMSEGCLLVGSDEIGAVPYLVKDGENGMIFKSKDLASLYEKVIWAIEHPKETMTMRKTAVRTILYMWSPENAAKSLLQLIDDLQQGRETSIIVGPCSKA